MERVTKYSIIKDFVLTCKHKCSFSAFSVSAGSGTSLFACAKKLKFIINENVNPQKWYLEIGLLKNQLMLMKSDKS